MSPPAHRRQEGDLVAVGQGTIPGRELAVHRHAQAFGGERQAVAAAQFLVQRACIAAGGGDRFAVAAGGVAQRGEVQHAIVHGSALPARTRRLPPDFSSSLTLAISISCDSALHMSYTVSAATVAPVSASISTPVLWRTATSQRIASSVAETNVTPNSQCSIASGWQNGMSSWVRLTASVPAMIAVSTIGPFFARRPAARNCRATAGGNRTSACAAACRAVTGLE